MIKILTDDEILIASLENALSGSNDDILKWMADFSRILTIRSFGKNIPHNQSVYNTETLADMGKSLSVLNIPKEFDFKPFMQAFENAGFRPFPVRSEYNLSERTDMGEFIIRSVLTLYDDAAESPFLSRTENGLIYRDFRTYEHLPTSVIKVAQNTTPAMRLAKTMARPNKYHS